MTDDHEVSDSFAADPADRARTIVKRPGMYIGVSPSADVVRAFVSGLELAVLTARGSSPLTDDDHRRLRDLPDGDCSEAILELEPLLVTMLTALKMEGQR